ncbi:MAG: YHYH protein [Myxococcota bacterium]
MSDFDGSHRRSFLHQSIGGLATLTALRNLVACSDDAGTGDDPTSSLAAALGAFGRYELTEDGRRKIFSDGDPMHATGLHSGFLAISTELDVEFRAPAEPQRSDVLIPLELVDGYDDGDPRDYPDGVFDAGAGRLAYNFGIGPNGIPYDPRGPWYQSNPTLGWHFNLLETDAFVNIGMDANCAHTHFGVYHYHGVPWGLVRSMRDFGFGDENVLVGLAADGYPIYYNPSVDSSYVLRTGSRPGRGGPGAHPAGPYDGAFEQDYVHDPSAGPLDATNSMYVETAEYPDGVDAYFVTRSFPGVPRYFRGVPDVSFMHEETSGCAPMPNAFWAYGGLSDAEIQEAQGMTGCTMLPPGGSPPASMETTPVKGVPESYSEPCASCHGAEGETLYGLMDSRSLPSFRDWLRGNGRGGSMPTYDADRLSDAAIEEIYTYLRQL